MNWATDMRRFRRLHGIKQVVLAEMLGVDQATVSRWENNKQTPDLAACRRLRDLLWRMNTRVDVDAGLLLAAPFAARTIVRADNVIIGASRLVFERVKRDQADLLGTDVRRVRQDSHADQLYKDVNKAFFAGEIRSVTTRHFSAAERNWVELFTIPIFINGRIESLNERQVITDPARCEHHIEAVAFEAPSF